MNKEIVEKDLSGVACLATLIWPLTWLFIIPMAVGVTIREKRDKSDKVEVTEPEQS